MGAQPKPFPIYQPKSRQGSLGTLRDCSSNEFVFAVVGHAGSGTSEIANALCKLLGEPGGGSEKSDVILLKASTVIVDWAKQRSKPLPPEGGKKLLSSVRVLQDYGDEMRNEPDKDGQPDHGAVAKGLIGLIRKSRAARTNASAAEGVAIMPDGSPRAYILDSIRHPGEVKLLRSVYGDAFVLIGVVCEEGQRMQRVTRKYADAGEENALKFMERDADDEKKYGQHVGDAFHLADYFVDNTADRAKGSSYNVPEDLSRLVKIVTHSVLIRPGVAETAMYHAFSAQMQSACLSRQVGAAVVDAKGNVVATGSNEVPKAGGGVHGEGTDEGDEDGRCFTYGVIGCRNTREQKKITEDLVTMLEGILGPHQLDDAARDKIRAGFRKSKIGRLLEFSRSVHAEMDAILSAARSGVSLVGCKLFVTTFPCHFCARHIVTAGIEEVQYIEPYPKSLALTLHDDSITIEAKEARGAGGKRVLFRPFSGVAPHLYRRAFLKDRELKNKDTGAMEIGPPEWTPPWYLSASSYAEIEAKLSEKETTADAT